MPAPPLRSPEPSVRALAARVAAPEAPLADLEDPFSETMYRMRREVAGVPITLGRLAAHAGVPVATDEEIDVALDRHGDAESAAFFARLHLNHVRRDMGLVLVEDRRLNSGDPDAEGRDAQPSREVAAE